MSTSKVQIALVLPDLLGTYGDFGNAVVLEKRMTWRGISAEIVQHPVRRAGAGVVRHLRGRRR